MLGRTMRNRWIAAAISASILMPYAAYGQQPAAAVDIYLNEPNSSFPYQNGSNMPVSGYFDELFNAQVDHVIVRLTHRDNPGRLTSSVNIPEPTLGWTPVINNRYSFNGNMTANQWTGQTPPPTDPYTARVVPYDGTGALFPDSQGGTSQDFIGGLTIQ